MGRQIDARRKSSRGPKRDRASGGKLRPLWVTLCESGLAKLLAKELKYRKIIARSTRAKPLFLRNYDVLVIPDVQVTGDFKSSRLSLHTLRCQVFGRGSITASQLDLLAEVCESAGVEQLVSSVAGSHFKRRDLNAWVKSRLAERGVSVGRTDSRRLVWLVVVDDRFYFGLPIQNHHDAAGRKSRGVRAGALPATVAAAMVFAAELARKEVIWDPMAGSGTILEEAAAMAPDAELIGSDTDPAALATAARRVPRADFVTGRVDSIDVGRKDVTLTLCNPPWEHQYQSETDQDAMFRSILTCSLKVAGPRWRAVLITPHGDALKNAADSVGNLVISRIAEPTVRGRTVGLWRVDRRG